jgi:hypothetical protein
LAERDEMGPPGLERPCHRPVLGCEVGTGIGTACAPVKTDLSPVLAGDGLRSRPTKDGDDAARADPV